MSATPAIELAGPAPGLPLPEGESIPAVPRSIAETGLRRELVLELVMKAIYSAGRCTGQDVARTLRLPYPLLEGVFDHLRREQFIEVKGFDGLARSAYSFQMTEAGRLRTRELLERSQYVGPAPVTLAAYSRWVRGQSVARAEHAPDFLRRGLAHLVVAERLLNSLGPAVLSGRSIFLYGPAGNGKTVLAEAIAAALGGALYVPHAVEVDGHVIKVFDPAFHRQLEPAAGPPEPSLHREELDPRWVRTRRPVVFTGGELTLAMLDLQFNALARYYEAPFQVKANGGVFVIDDFGRQLVSPRDLLNRWIVPLEKREDYLTLHTGMKFAVPFDTLIIFATNLNPWELVDEAFLRRIRYKVLVENPTREQVEQLFRATCAARGIEYRAEALDFVYDEYYGKRGIAPRFSHPRDLVDHVQDALRYRGGDACLSRAALRQACEDYFLQSALELAARSSA